jgi:hypothetical protein
MARRWLGEDLEKTWRRTGEELEKVMVGVDVSPCVSRQLMLG